MHTIARVDPKIDKAIRRLAKMSAPEMAFAAGNLINQLESALVLVGEMRLIAVQMMLQDGLSYDDIAALLGLEAELLKSNVALSKTRPLLDS